MSLQNTEKQYGSLSKSLHWLVAILILGMLLLGFMMGDFNKSSMRFYYNLHKSIGIIILFLVIIRMIWNIRHKSPAYERSMSRGMQVLARASHGVMYLAILIMPLAGWIMATASNSIPHFLGWFYFPMPGISANSSLAHLAHETHEIFSWVIIVLLSLHIIAVFGHQVIRKDNVLHRMMPKRN